MRRVIGVSLLGVVLGVLSGCDLVSSFAKEIVVAASSHRGWSTFTFKGQLPAEFGIDAIAFYGPDDPNKSSSQAATFTPGKTVTRQHGQRYTTAISDQPQAFSFDIPLSYYEGLCGMKLGRVALEINARYGKQKWQQAYGRGNLYISNSEIEGKTTFPPSGIFNISAQCSFLFQESKLYTDIDKQLTCAGTGAHLNLTNLIGSTVHLTIESNPEERPYYDQTWIKFPSGWKPCLPKQGWIKCQSPPIFKTFQMNGQTCTVYPSCVE